MPPFFNATRSLAATACALSLAACSTAPVAPPPTPKLQDLLTQAAQAAGAGQKEQAIKLWEKTAVAYPADKAPWASIAQTRYEAGQYGDAIVNAQEVLVRDPNDQVANSIIAISGLRLSTRALGELSRQNHLSGSLRTESQDLAKLLRESLGETVLVPVAAAPVVKPTVTAERPRATVSKKTGGAKASNDGGSSADPFSVLK
ncbi:MAG: hypothetical protein ABIT83_06490 [Massilia sp.]